MTLFIYGVLFFGLVEFGQLSRVQGNDFKNFNDVKNHFDSVNNIFMGCFFVCIYIIFAMLESLNYPLSALF